jgi:GTP-binding protein
LKQSYLEHDEWAGEVKKLTRGAIISTAQGLTTAYALKDVQDKGPLFVGINVPTYMGHVIGEHVLETDMEMNPCKTKHLTNVRTKGHEEAINLTTPRNLSLEEAITYIRDDELVEVTPKWIRIRKRILDQGARARIVRKDKNEKHNIKAEAKKNK